MPYIVDMMPSFDVFIYSSMDSYVSAPCETSYVPSECNVSCTFDASSDSGNALCIGASNHPIIRSSMVVFWIKNDVTVVARTMAMTRAAMLEIKP